MRLRPRVRGAGLVAQGVAAAVLLAAPRPVLCQYTPSVSGAVGFLHNTNKGVTGYAPNFMPVALVPVGQHVLFETRGTFVESITPGTNGRSERTRFNRGYAFIQLDVLATRHTTFVLGKFQTPFATYNERLSPIWIGKFQDGPLTFPIGNNGAAGTGGEMRGSLFSGSKMSIDYATFYASNVTGGQFKSTRATGGRMDVYFPGTGVEVGTSYTYIFSGAHPNAFGAHFWWQPVGGALAVKSEYAHSTHSQGYWIETAYRLLHWKGPESAIGRLEPVFRLQQTFRNSPDGTDNLPGVDTHRADFGLNYFLPHEVRINGSYSRQFASTGNGNIWRTGLTYRFVLPAWPGKKQ